jgi:hypothetical protein
MLVSYLANVEGMDEIKYEKMITWMITNVVNNMTIYVEI